jgi:sulfur carrier protein ThiS
VLHQNPPHFEKQELARVKNIVPCQIYQIPLLHNLGLNIGFGATTCMTNEAHTSGTARIAQVLEILGIDDEQIIVNVQGDEPK